MILRTLEISICCNLFLDINLYVHLFKKCNITDEISLIMAIYTFTNKKFIFIIVILTYIIWKSHHSEEPEMKNMLSDGDVIADDDPRLVKHVVTLIEEPVKESLTNLSLFNIFVFLISNIKSIT